MKKIKRKNHWVPRFYLKYFSIIGTDNTNNPKINVFSKKMNQSFVRAINDIPVNNFLYCPIDDKGFRNDDAENLLSEVESFIAKIWIDFATKYVDFKSKGIRKAILIFIISMYLRNITQLHRLRSIKDFFINIFRQIPKDQNGNPMVDRISTNYYCIDIDRTHYQEYINPPYDIEHEMFVDSIFSNTFEYVELFIDKKWSILESEKSRFITTDNPVTFYNKTTNNFGLATAGTIILFPLSPKFLLMIHDYDNILDNRYYTVESHIKYNKLLWNNANDFIFSNGNIDEVVSEINEK